MQTKKSVNLIGIVGAGAMGSGIAQIASQAGHDVVLFDLSQEALTFSSSKLQKVMNRLIEKGKVTSDEAIAIQERIVRTTMVTSLKDCDLIIEAVVEDLEVKKRVFKSIEEIASKEAIIASNTSSLSITSLASFCAHPERVVGLHFFNPAPLMPLVEIIPALQTNRDLPKQLTDLMRKWGKSPVIAKDTPGFIVNRVARPFYGEALRILDEGIADVPTIDAAMRESGFIMGPFQLMDLIGHDVNYAVTKSVFKSFYYDPRYMPSITQLKLVEAGWLGRKSGRGFYNYNKENEATVVPGQLDPNDQIEISERIISMLINEASDAVYLGIASADDVDIAMLKGVNYPKGLLVWAEELGLQKIVSIIDALRDTYGETRYRCSPLLRKLAAEGGEFHK
ncbi:MAG: 3-hydroxyacyl-CoA dehydrogenase NAD-binding domain-containing protein [Bacteroidetes bacterium]|jgi:3-hydroxybutyryl-CoA dehydrogenase|nr:3-hydroxyacyl-CoA dehydrogenase NAD-binding domain-containing protein [Bacteroidota bacterium]MDA1383071.1 3-hydroxyacyl-CoA dehydrogenase NAD-binding domain-containing protein [Bacteroidota bacterium]